MGKDPKLLKIYNKIHRKLPLTLDDLRYLADYAPECFEKTCNNLVHNMPEAKSIIEVKEPTPSQPNKLTKPASTPQYNIDYIIDNIIKLEANELPLVNIDADNVKNLLGSLYMELLISQNKKDATANVQHNGNTSLFDTRI